MEFQILGLLEVRGEHGAVALVGTKPRAVLAVLRLHARQPVSVERPAVALGGEGPGEARGDGGGRRETCAHAGRHALVRVLTSCAFGGGLVMRLVGGGEAGTGA